MPIRLDDNDYEIIDFRENRTVLIYDNIKNEDYPKHWHNTIEIIMPDKGCRTAFIKGKPFNN